MSSKKYVLVQTKINLKDIEIVKDKLRSENEGMNISTAKAVERCVSERANQIVNEK